MADTIAPRCLFTMTARTHSCSKQPNAPIRFLPYNLSCVRDDGTQGTVIWTKVVGHNWAEGSVDEDGNYYLACFADRIGILPYTMFKFDIAGNELWKVAYQDGAQWLSTATGSPSFSADGSRLYVGGHGSRLWCLKHSRWLADLGEAVGSCQHG